MNAPTYNTCQTTKAGNIILPKGRLTFAQHILKAGKPKSAPATQELKFSTGFLISKTCDLTLLRQALLAVAKEKWGAQMPAKLVNPILEAKDHDYEGYTDQFWLVRPTSKQKPGLVAANGQHITDESEVYSGRWARISVRPFTYDVSGNRGVSLGLQNVQLLDHDESLGGRARAEDEFEPVEGAAGPADGAGPTEDNPFG